MASKTGFLFSLMACVAVPMAAMAQNPQPSPPHEEHPTVTPPGPSQTPPEQIAPGSSLPPTRSGETLSNKLARDQGTLQPPKVDPGIQAPLPSRTQDTMPVIRPPGTPGGNQTVVPK